MKILIIKLRNIGDVLLITPLFENLKAHFPNCQIDCLVNSNTKDILPREPINKILTLDKKGSKLERLKRELTLLKDIKNAKYDIVLGLTNGDRTAFLSFISKAKIRVGFTPKNLWSKYFYTHNLTYKHQHTIESNLDSLRILNIPIISKKVISNTADSFRNEIKLPQRFIHCHFFSNWFFKCLSDEFCATIIKLIEEKYKTKCILTLSNAQKEAQKLKNIQKIYKKEIISFNNLSLPEVSLLNKQAIAFIGVDTAIMHLSGANNIPSFAFFGPSSVREWGVWDNDVASEYDNDFGIQRVGKHTIYQESLSCIPCHRAGCNDSKISKCLVELQENLALKTLEDFLGKLSLVNP